VSEDDQSRDMSWLFPDFGNLIKLKQIGFSGKLEIIQRNYPDLLWHIEKLECMKMKAWRIY
jgi:hypothetical protein